MSEIRLHESPSWAAVAGEQFRMLALSLRNIMLLGGVAMVLGTVLFVVSWWKAQSAPDATFHMRFLPLVATPLIVGGFFLPLAVWKNEDPSRRGYHWAMPLPRGRHTLTRSLFGWVWFVIALLVYLLWVGTLSATLRVGEVRPVQVDAWQWLIPVVSITIAYLIGSTIVIASDHPWRWFVGIPVGFFVLIAFAGTAQSEWLIGSLREVFEGRWGLQAALSGRIQVEEIVTRPDGREIIRRSMRPDFGAWIGAASLWLSFGILGTLTAALRHQER